ncbi:glutamate-1-semialdehyde 2,1-aminomutase [Hippea maritima]|uniref:Glutamate-1-semialdehyde 2,1-aminomutase n=1 Tax=Hippea maritima (strain ATCC 700847 / DSM 10411 / MH2) TaxID=760142 RepID=F2LVN1_HIPMA|nr:glutamate-1-semialdehyde 2,1-aminomutase [Hippea maritima]AEA33815.1 Glutamate-1-semialdehyde 2,1-aminomutase [Hippea maritima DSM 10411]
MFDKSRELFEEAKKYIAGGVNSPVRAFKNVGRHPLFIKKAKGSKIYDEDGNEFIDYVNSWGPAILGHADDEVINKTKDALDNGFSFGAPTILETELAKRIVRAFDSIEIVRFVNSGTEAAMSAIRLARGFTSRDNILKFNGCYHGHSDSLLVGAGSGSSTFGIPSSKGVPVDFAKHTILAEFNDLDGVEEIFKKHGDTIAAVIIEPVAGNMGVIKPKDGFLKGLRSICDKHGSLLIFDEVMTGFRLTYGGAQHIYNITPDITVLGKVVGGGFPVACFGAKREIMKYLAPEGDVYQAGTLSGNPVAMACGIATLDILKRKNPYKDLEKNTSKIVSRIMGLANQYGIPASGESIGSMFSVFFMENKPSNYRDVQKSNLRLFTNYFIGLLERGIYIPPSQFESNFITIKHSLEDIENTLVAVEDIFKEIASGKFYV